MRHSVTVHVSPTGVAYVNEPEPAPASKQRGWENQYRKKINGRVNNRAGVAATHETNHWTLIDRKTPNVNTTLTCDGFALPREARSFGDVRRVNVGGGKRQYLRCITYFQVRTGASGWVALVSGAFRRNSGGVTVTGRAVETARPRRSSEHASRSRVLRRTWKKRGKFETNGAHVTRHPWQLGRFGRARMRGARRVYRAISYQLSAQGGTDTICAPAILFASIINVLIDKRSNFVLPTRKIASLRLAPN